MKRMLSILVLFAASVVYADNVYEMLKPYGEQLDREMKKLTDDTIFKEAYWRKDYANIYVKDKMNKDLDWVKISSLWFETKDFLKRDFDQVYSEYKRDITRPGTTKNDIREYKERLARRNQLAKDFITYTKETNAILNLRRRADLDPKEWKELYSLIVPYHFKYCRRRWDFGEGDIPVVGPSAGYIRTPGVPLIYYIPLEDVTWQHDLANFKKANVPIEIIGKTTRRFPGESKTIEMHYAFKYRTIINARVKTTYSDGSFSLIWRPDRGIREGGIAYHIPTQWDDPKGPFDAVEYFDKNKRLLIADRFYLLAHPEEFHPKYWPFRPTKERKKDDIPYLGMIDDDLVYDFTRKNPFEKIMTFNKKGPFLYVYDFERLRKMCAYWNTHDTILYGWKQPGDDMETAITRITHGPLLDDPNAIQLRLLRINQFLRLLYAKQYVAKHVHPAPEWSEEIADYIIRDYRPGKGYTKWSPDGPDYLVERKNKVIIDPIIAAQEHPDPKEYMKWLLTCANERYWELFDRYAAWDYVNHFKIIDYFEEGDKETAKEMRALALYRKMFADAAYLRAHYRSPGQIEYDKSRYETSRYLSVGIWFGQAGWGQYSHQADFVAKSTIPYFEREDKPGRLYTKDQYKSNPVVVPFTNLKRALSPRTTV